MSKATTKQENNRRREELRAALSERDPDRVAAAIDLPPIQTQEKPKKDVPVPNFEDSLVDNTNNISADWSGVLKSLHESCYAAKIGNSDKCYEAQSSLHSGLNCIFAASAGNWLLPALHKACENTHRVALLADAAASKGGKNEHTRLSAAVTVLQDSFSKTLNDRKDHKPNTPLSEEGSKKAGVLSIVNQLFSMYFRLNTLRLCKNLQIPVEKRRLHEQGPMGHMVTYRYYVGRLNMFEDQYESAEKNLDFALHHCHCKALSNKKRILNYLLPVKLLRGRLPSQRLLDKYSLVEFAPLVNGMRKGDLRTFNDGLSKYQDLFIRRGTYLILEKCKTICYRNLLKRIYLILGKSQIPLGYIGKSLHWLGMPMDLDEVECILANLIFRGFVRGYISHTKRILVLSKKDAFPVSAVIATNKL